MTLEQERASELLKDRRDYRQALRHRLCRAYSSARKLTIRKQLEAVEAEITALEEVARLKKAA